MRPRVPFAGWIPLVVLGACHEPEHAVARRAVDAVEAEAWMDELYGAHPDVRLGDVLLPGTHDSASYGCAVENGISPSAGPLLLGLWDLPGADDGGTSRQRVVGWARTQDRTIRQQLDDGIRALDLRVTRKGDALLTWHSVYSVPLSVVLDDLVAFAVERPTEVVVFTFGLDLRPSDWPDLAAELVAPRADGASVCDLLLDLPGPVADVTLGELRASGRNLVWGDDGGLGDLLRDELGCPTSSFAIDGHWSRTTTPDGVAAMLAATVATRAPGRLLSNDFIFSLEGTSNLLLQGGFVTGHDSLRDATVALGFSGDLPGRMIATYDEGAEMNVFNGDFYELTDLIPAAIASNRADLPAVEAP